MRLAKNGQARSVPLNSAARSALLDLVAKRARPGEPGELVSHAAYRTISREFMRAVAAAQATLRAAGREEQAARLDGVRWHALRHTCASRLVAAGVDLRTVQELGGWKTLSAAVRAPLPRPPGRCRREDRSGALRGRRQQALGKFGKTSTLSGLSLMKLR